MYFCLLWQSSPLRYWLTTPLLLYVIWQLFTVCFSSARTLVLWMWVVNGRSLNWTRYAPGDTQSVLQTAESGGEIEAADRMRTTSWHCHSCAKQMLKYEIRVHFTGAFFSLFYIMAVHEAKECTIIVFKVETFALSERDFQAKSV